MQLQINHWLKVNFHKRFRYLFKLANHYKMTTEILLVLLMYNHGRLMPIMVPGKMNHKSLMQEIVMIKRLLNLKLIKGMMNHKIPILLSQLIDILLLMMFLLQNGHHHNLLLILMLLELLQNLGMTTILMNHKIFILQLFHMLRLKNQNL